MLFYHVIPSKRSAQQAIVLLTFS